LASSPYAKTAVLWETYCKTTGDALTLVAHGASKVFNPTLPQRVIDRALREGSSEGDGGVSRRVSHRPRGLRNVTRARVRRVAVPFNQQHDLTPHGRAIEMAVNAALSKLFLVWDHKDRQDRRRYQNYRMCRRSLYGNREISRSTFRQPPRSREVRARFFDHAGLFGPCDGASEACCLPRSKQRRHPGLSFRGSVAGLCPPLPTLRRRPRGRQRTARGRCGS
jgi:hypothetical protein